MKHLGTKTLETPRLLLRPFRMEDAELMYQNWAKDPKVTRYLTWPAHSSLDITKAVLADWTQAYSQMDWYQWAIVDRALEQPVGSISVVSHNDKAELAHIGYCLGRRWWGQGIMTEALQAVMDFLFEEVGMNRLESRHDPRNPGSGKVMMKCGMKFEGLLRQSDWNNQGICDACWYGLIREER